MAFDAGLGERIREAFGGRPGLTERKMFGGIAFMVDGHMVVGIIGAVLMARVGPDSYQEALGLRHVRPMDFTGRPMKGYVYVDPPGIEEDDALKAWVARCLAFTATLAAKR